MRPLPRLLAFTTDLLCRAADFGIKASAIAAAGPAVALVVRAPESSAAQQAAFAERVTTLVRPPEAAIIVHARADLARAVGAQGVQLRQADPAPPDARRVLGKGWIGVSIHDDTEAREAIDAGADYLVAGSIYETASHPERPAMGLAWLTAIAQLGAPVIAIGGMTAQRAAEARNAGASGVAAISALWDAPDPAAAALGLLAPWALEVDP